MPTNPFARLALIFGAWTAFGLLSAAQTQLSLSIRGETRPLWSVLGVALIGAWIWAAYTPGVVAVTRRLRRLREEQPTRMRGWTRFLAWHAAVLAFICLVDPIVWASVRPLIDGVVVSISRVFAGVLMINIGAYLTVVTLTEALDYAARWRERERAAAALAQTAETLQKQLDDARLRALEAQLRPHFLYNTLNLVAELVHQEPQAADEMLTHLGTLLRRTYRETTQLVPLVEEVAFVRAYAEILARRYRDRATLTFALPPELERCPVPAFLLQPLVENAFRHGVERRERASLVEVSARQVGDSLQIRVRDRLTNAPRDRRLVHELIPQAHRLAPAADGESGIGLRNTRERLAVLYGAAAGVTLVETLNETVASVWLPYSPETSRPDETEPPVSEAVGV